MNRLKLTLEENAHSFLEDAISNAVVAEESPARWKFAILSMIQSIELNLKRLLAEVHPLFVYENVDKPIKTVSLDHAVRRLVSVKRLTLSKTEEEALRLAKQARDEITHYEVDQDVTHLKLSFSRLLGFLADFHDLHFKISLHDVIDEDLWSKSVAIKIFGQELHERAMKRAVTEKAGEIGRLEVCPACNWRPMVVHEDGEGVCYVCGWQETMGFCGRCDAALPEEQCHELHGKTYCESCLEYMTDDYWYEQRAGK